MSVLVDGGAAAGLYVQRDGELVPVIDGGSPFEKVTVIQSSYQNGQYLSSEVDGYLSYWDSPEVLHTDVHIRTCMLVIPSVMYLSSGSMTVPTPGKKVTIGSSTYPGFKFRITALTLWNNSTGRPDYPQANAFDWDENSMHKEADSATFTWSYLNFPPAGQTPMVLFYNYKKETTT